MNDNVLESVINVLVVVCLVGGLAMGLLGGYMIGNITTTEHYEDVITKLELQLNMSIDR